MSNETVQDCFSVFQLPGPKAAEIGTEYTRLPMASSLLLRTNQLRLVCLMDVITTPASGQFNERYIHTYRCRPYLTSTSLHPPRFHLPSSVNPR